MVWASVLCVVKIMRYIDVGSFGFGVSDDFESIMIDRFYRYLRTMIYSDRELALEDDYVLGWSTQFVFRSFKC